MQRFQKYLFLATAIFVMNTCGVIPVCCGSEGNPENYLEFVERLSLTYAPTIVISPDGQFVYVPLSESFEIYSRDFETGKLTYLDSQSFGETVNTRYCKAVISASGNTFAMISFHDHALRVFDRDSDTGALSNMRVAQHTRENPIPITQPQAIAISPQGKHVYVACYSDPLVSFEVTPATLNIIDEGRNDGEDDVSISSDGKYVYTIYPSARRQRAIKEYVRNDDPSSPNFGKLNLVRDRGILADNIAAGLDNQLFALGKRDSEDKLIMLKRDTHGLLIEDSQAGSLEKTNAGRSLIAAAPDGSVYTLAVSGVLTYLSIFTYNDDGIFERVGSYSNKDKNFEGILQPSIYTNMLAVTSDSRHVYVSRNGGTYPYTGITVLTTDPPAKPEPLCDGIDDDGNGIIDDGCYSCEAGDFFQVGERQYCFDFGNRPQSYAEAETICDLYDADLAAYGGEDNTETRDNIIDIIAIHRSLWPRNLFGTLHGEPAGGNIILDECSALNEQYPDDPEIFSDPAKPGEHDHCSASVLAHFAYEPFGESLAGLLEDGGFGDAFGVTCERAIPDRLLLHYKFTQNVGGNKAIDGSGHHNHGDIIGAEWVENGKDYALAFEGSVDDYVQFAPPGPLTQGTVAAWVMQESFQDMGWSFLTFSPVPLGGRDNAVIFGVQATHTAPYVGFGIDSDSEGWKYAVSSTELQPDTWYHLAATWGPNGMRVYVNGRLEGENAYSGPLPNGMKYAYLAAETWHPYFDGAIDDVRIYSRALDEAEMQSLYESTRR